MLTELQKENSQLSSSNKSYSAMLDDASQNYRELKGKFDFNASLIEFFSINPINLITHFLDKLKLLKQSEETIKNKLQGNFSILKLFSLNSNLVINL